jgi:hypothetical protein
MRSLSSRLLGLFWAAFLAAAPLAAQQGRACQAPLWFEPLPEAGGFYARAAGGVTYRVAADRCTARAGNDEVTLAVAGALAAASLEALEPVPGVSHYYFGRDPAGWRTHVPHFARLEARDVRPGIDLVWRGAGRELEFDLLARAGADPAGLRLRVLGTRAARPRLLPDGAVALALASGELRLQPPFVYQNRSSARLRVPSRYVVHGDEIGFDLGEHAPDLELTIDPVVTFATLLGGSGNETGVACAVDNQGNMAVTGTTTSTDFPLRNNLNLPPLLSAMFVTKFDRQGNLVYSTLFGGPGTGGATTPVGIGFDPQGWCVFGGNTGNANLPVTQGVVQPVLIGTLNWFFTALDPAGALMWCTYYGGAGGTGARMTALHVLDVLRGSVIATGVGSVPLMPNAYSGIGQIAVAGIFGGNVLWVSTQVGFSGTPNAIDVTQNGHVCIAGSTSGPGLPTTATSFQQGPQGSLDGFVFVFFGTANSLVFCTYFGGTSSDVPRRLRAVSGPGTVHCTIAGETNSTDLPVRNAIQPTRRSSTDCFVARLNGNMSGLDYSTYFGGANTEMIGGLELASDGSTFVGGWTNSLDLQYRNTLRYTISGSNQDGWVLKLDPSGAQMVWCTAVGGNNNDILNDLALGPGNEIVVAGTAGPPFPTTANALPAPVPAGNDAFLVQLADETFESYGTSTAGYWNWRPVLAGGGSARIGTTATFNVHDGRARAFGVLAVGAGRTQIPFLNGFLWTVPLVTFAVQLRGSTATVFEERGGGYLHWSVPIPGNTALIGATTDWQGFFLDAAAVGGLTMTNGVELVVR